MPTTATSLKLLKPLSTTATPAAIETAAREAAVAEISGALNASLYAVTQAELRRFKRLESLIIKMQADKDLLEAKFQLAKDSDAPIQDGDLTIVIEVSPARASTSWKDLYADVVGDAVVKSREAEAKIAAANKPGTKKLKVFKKEVR